MISKDGRFLRGSHENEFLQTQPLRIPSQKSCAVIGNSGILLNSGCGETINQYDFVFRSNLAATKGYETDVGDKLNITSINRHGLEELVDEITLNRPADQSVWKDSFLDRLKSLNKSVLWYTLNDPTEEVMEMLGIVEKTCEQNGLDIVITYSQNTTSDFVKR